MSRAELIAAQCQGKERMPASVARRVAKRMTRKHKVPLESYKCDVCGEYHVGKRPGKGRTK